ncbi:PspC domain-containing protein [Paraferrimonas sp. SM1919]|uniref:PspC domain-containing protein n=1 Tax=Paraferrimonas sp. SM1919 TaxID=2662263 RepID=UPI0013D18932|nr:PspC domain-containing protein [Paraferrimonas sp. SM1919]
MTIYKDPSSGVFMGVIAGLANHWQVPRLWLRIAAVVLLVSMPEVTALAYIIAGLCMPNRLSRLRD